MLACLPRGQRGVGGALTDVIHLRTVRALSMVSAVVKVLDTTITMVVSGSSPFRERATSMGSTFARNRN